jgi:hypothetical protein
MDAFLKKCRRLMLGMLCSLQWPMDGNNHVGMRDAQKKANPTMGLLRLAVPAAPQNVESP